MAQRVCLQMTSSELYHAQNLLEDAVIPYHTELIIMVLFFCFSGSPDILICGNCREMFTDLVDMLDHKRDYCKLR